MKPYFILLSFFVCLTAFSDEMLPPVLEFTFATQPAVFEQSSPQKPLVITTLKQAEAVFTQEGMNSLKENIEFTQQTVLVFAWRGSGQDRLVTSVAESFPEQLTITYKRGMTRDLRSHVVVYAVRNNVKWTTR